MMTIELTEDKFGMHSGEVRDPDTGNTIFLTALQSDGGWWVFVNGQRVDGTYRTKILAAEAAEAQIASGKVSDVPPPNFDSVTSHQPAKVGSNIFTKVAVVAVACVLLPIAAYVAYAGFAAASNNNVLPAQNEPNEVADAAKHVPLPVRPVIVEEYEIAYNASESRSAADIFADEPAEEPKSESISAPSGQNTHFTAAQRSLRDVAVASIKESQYTSPEEHVASVEAAPIKTDQDSAHEREFGDSVTRNIRSRVRKPGRERTSFTAKSRERSAEQTRKRKIHSSTKNTSSRSAAKKRIKHRTLRRKARSRGRSIVLKRSVIRTRGGRKIVRLKIRRPRNRAEYRQFQRLRNKIIASQLRSRRRRSRRF